MHYLGTVFGLFTRKLRFKKHRLLKRANPSCSSTFSVLGRFFLEDAKKNRSYLQIQVDFLIKDLAEAITTLQRGIFLSTLGRSYFAPLHSQLDPLMTELLKLHREVNDYAKGGKQAKWQRGFEFYYQETLGFLQRQALLYDQVNQVFGLPTTNIKDLTSEISK